MTQKQLTSDEDGRPTVEIRIKVRLKKVSLKKHESKVDNVRMKLKKLTRFYQ